MKKKNKGIPLNKRANKRGEAMKGGKKRNGRDGCEPFNLLSSEGNNSMRWKVVGNA